MKLLILQIFSMSVFWQTSCLLKQLEVNFKEVKLENKWHGLVFNLMMELFVSDFTEHLFQKQNPTYITRLFKVKKKKKSATKI